MGTGRDETDDGPDGRYVAPVGRVGRRTSMAPWVIVVGLAIGLAILKPWGAPVVEPTPLVQADATQTPLGRPSQAADADGAEIGSMCLDTSAWLVASEEQLSGRPVRIWRAIEPVETVRPSGPAIPWVPITSESVTALGWCGPESGDGRLADPTSVEAWALAPTGIRQVALVRLRPTRVDSNLGGLFRPALVPTAMSPTSAWPAGRYLFRVRSGDGRTVTFGVEVELVPGATL